MAKLLKEVAEGWRGCGGVGRGCERVGWGCVRRRKRSARSGGQCEIVMRGCEIRGRGRGSGGGFGGKDLCMGCEKRG